ncbi:MAG: ABC transporter ATP-binding protein [Anaerolineae bacterium]|nr:ABC transporter ATP-binding protein [Anaerolineae bacterium]
MSLLTIDRLTAGYGKLQILHDLTLRVDSGQFVGVFGPNGSGKSTLIKTIFGLTKIFAGTITLDGTALNDVPTEKIGKHGIAYVPQTHNVFTAMTIRENLLLAGRHLKPDEFERALADIYEMFPILGERRAQRAGQLSGGERQMLAISIAFMPRPRLMLLDEPSAALSPLLVTEIFKQLRRLCERGITLVVVEQNARSLLRWCDFGYILREGQVVFQGSAADILADEETAKTYLGVGSTKLAARP